MSGITEVKFTAEVTAFGQTREIELYGWVSEENPSLDRLWSRSLVAVGQFPTGKKLHASSLTLWAKEQSNGRTLNGKVGAVVDGREYIVDGVLYQNNSNRGRLVAWNDDLANSGWRGY